MKPVIYQQEIDDGLADQFGTCFSISYDIPVLTAEKNYVGKVKNVSSIVGKLIEDDFIYEYPAILATAGVWNLNDQVFDKFEVWKAKYTPLNKPSNLNHQPDKVVGHTSRVFAITDEESPKNIPAEIDGKPNMDIPDTYHLLTVDSFYKYFIKAYQSLNSEAFIEKNKETYDGIVSGELSVSMECIFSDFDYALMDKNGTQKIVKRDNNTSFLSKKLRKFGGTGEYQGYRVGMLMRDIMFTGKGITDNPANPASVIFSKESLAFASQNYTKFEDILTSEISSAYITIVNGEHKMTLEQLQAKVTELESALAKSKTDLEEANKSKVELDSTKTEVATLKSEIAATTEKLTAAEKAVKDSAQALEVANKETKETKEKLSVAESDLTKVKAEKIKSDRIAAIKEQLSLSKEDSEADYLTVASLTDENFAAWLENTKKRLESKDKSKVEIANKLAEAQKELDKLNAANASKQLEGAEKAAANLGVANVEEAGANQKLSNSLKDLFPSKITK